MHKRTKKLAISTRVKEIVWERDSQCCILCGVPGNPWCHYISRAHSGLGVEENIVTLCNGCHYIYDNGSKEQREAIRERLREYLMEQYPSWNEDELIYRKL